VLKVTPHADLPEFAITGEGVLEPLLRQVRSVPKSVVTPAGLGRIWMPEFQGVVETR